MGTGSNMVEISYVYHLHIFYLNSFQISKKSILFEASISLEIIFEIVFEHLVDDPKLKKILFFIIHKNKLTKTIK